MRFGAFRSTWKLFSTLEKRFKTHIIPCTIWYPAVSGALSDQPEATWNRMNAICFYMTSAIRRFQAPPEHPSLDLKERARTYFQTRSGHWVKDMAKQLSIKSWPLGTPAKSVKITTSTLRQVHFTDSFPVSVVFLRNQICGGSAREQTVEKNRSWIGYRLYSI